MSRIDGGLRKLFRERLPQFHWVSVESGATGAGIPDMNYCRDGVEGWLELKQTPGHAVTLRPDQVGWLCRRARHGGKVFIATRQQAPAGPRREARDALWLTPGHMAKEAKELGLWGLSGRPGVLFWQGGPARWNWDAVAAALVA